MDFKLCSYSNYLMEDDIQDDDQIVNRLLGIYGWQEA